MQLQRAVCVVSAAVLVLCGVYWAVRATREPPPPPVDGASVVKVEPALCVGDLLSEAKADPSGRVGLVRVRSATGKPVLGFVTARAFRERDGEPVPDEWCDLTAVQMGDAIDVRPWLRASPKPGRWFLAVTARLADAEYAIGWTRLEVPNVATASWSVELPARAAHRVEVATTDGAPVPGALVDVQTSDSFSALTVSHLVYTGADGAATVHWPIAAPRGSVLLPEGVGPSVKQVCARVDAAAGLTRLVAGVSGAWSFHPASVSMALPGSSTRVERLDSSRAEVLAYPVARHVGPGRWPATPLWVMTLGDARGAPVGATIEFAKRKPMTVADVAARPRLTLGIDGMRTGDALAASPKSADAFPPARGR